MNLIRGVFLSDVHLPWGINLSPVLEYIRDFKPTEIVLGGDIIDASGLHGIDGFTPDRVERDILGPKGFYIRDVNLFREFFESVSNAAPNAKFVILEGNHEERYQRIGKRYPQMFEGKFDFFRDSVPLCSKKATKWIDYGNYDSFYRVGDTLFTHGTLYPELHSRKYAYFYSPDKVVYGHLHDFQAYTMHRGDPDTSPKYAVTAGCLCQLTPDYKKGSPHKWTNGFISYVSKRGVTIPTVHLIDQGMFNVGAKLYGTK